MLNIVVFLYLLVISIAMQLQEDRSLSENTTNNHFKIIGPKFFLIGVQKGGMNLLILH